MSYSAIQNSPIVIDLTKAANDTGWTTNGTQATHESCNSGSIVLNNFKLVPNHFYLISYSIISVSGGYVNVILGSTQGAHRTTPGFYTETLQANDFNLSFFSNANCVIQLFNIRDTITDTSNFQKNTLVYDVLSKKWFFRTIAPDFGFSIATDMLTVYQGNLWLHKNGSDDRNNFYGVPYQTIIQFIGSKAPTVPQSFQSLSIQANQLMVTGDNGISTSLGQVSELASIDFVKNFLSDGTSSVAVQTVEGIYSAGFLRDKNESLLEGTPLRGNWILITLISTVNGPLQLFTVNVVSKQSKIGAR